MKTTITKKAVIIGIAILIYIAALPLTLYFSGAFKQAERPDLKRITEVKETQYAAKTDEEKRGILSGIGFDLQAFEDGGFDFSLSDIRVQVFSDEPDKIFSLSTTTTDEETYYITLTIYAPEADKMFPHFHYSYERREIDGKTIGYYEDTSFDEIKIRYRNAQTGYIYIVEPFFDIDDITTQNFIKLLVK